MALTAQPGDQKAIVTLVIDETGKIIAAQENGWSLLYGEKEQKKEIKIDGGDFYIRSLKTCCWRKRNGRWVCIPC